MSSEYFTLHQSIVDRDDLTIYEKMCCVVLARYAGKNEFEDRLSKDIIAMKMGCSNEDAYRALEGLVEKGIIESEDTDVELNELPQRDSRVIKKEKQNQFETMRFKELSGTLSASSPRQENPVTEAKINELQEFIEEVVSDNALRILLNIAEGDVDLIKQKYTIARSSQLNDAIEVLMHELQRKTPKIEDVPLELNKDSKEMVSQINQKRISDLYKRHKK